MKVLQQIHYTNFILYSPQNCCNCMRTLNLAESIKTLSQLCNRNALILAVGLKYGGMKSPQSFASEKIIFIQT